MWKHQMQSTGEVPPVLYRSFTEERFADALIEGRVWITTLEDCRKKEDQVRVDAGEGVLVYNTGFASSDENAADLELIAKRSRIGYVKGSPGVVIKDCQYISTIPHALLLCTSLERVAKFGRFCVRIDNPVEFFAALNHALCVAGRAGQQAGMGAVIYGERSYQATDPAPPPAAFIKPTQFLDEKEYRMVWPLDRPCEPFEFVCKDVVGFCTRIA
jgi:hypothetical protein